MSTPSPNEPKIVSHNIPIIEVYQVTDDELSRMEEAATNVGNEFAIMLAAISITITLLISLMQGKFEPDVEDILQSSGSHFNVPQPFSWVYSGIDTVPLYQR